MGLSLVSLPSATPVSLNLLRSHLSLDTTDYEYSFANSIDPAQHSTAGNFGLVGDAVELTLATAIFVVSVGTLGGGGNVIVKVQDSPDEIVWSDVYTFPTIFQSSQTLQYSYTGPAPYVRAVATVANSSCGFGVGVQLQALTDNLDPLLTTYINAGVDYAQAVQARQLCTAAYRFTLDRFPTSNLIYGAYTSSPVINDMTFSNFYSPLPWAFLPVSGIALPVANVQSITNFAYTDTNGNPATIAPNTYTLDTVGEPNRIVPKWGNAWPTTLPGIAEVVIDLTAGYASGFVPANTQAAILLYAGALYEKQSIPFSAIDQLLYTDSTGYYSAGAAIAKGY